MLQLCLQDNDGQIKEVNYFAGLDYPGVGPEHSTKKILKDKYWYH